MSWTLQLYGPDGQVLKKECTHLAPGGIVGGFRWRRTPHGDGLTLDFPAHIPTLGLGSRDLVRLFVNGAAVFYGPAVENPTPRDPSFGDVNVVGASELLARRVIGPQVYRNLDVGAIARDLVQRHRHPALTYSAAHIPDTGKVLSEFSMPWRTLRQALESLGKAVAGDRGVPFGALPGGEVFFGGQVAPSLPVAFSSVADFKPLRVSGDEVATRSYLIALSRASGSAPSQTTIYPARYEAASSAGSPAQSGLPYRPGTYTLRADDPSHAQIGAEVANLVPDGADVFTNPGAYRGIAVSNQDFVNPDAATDGDGTSYASNSAAASGGYLILRVPQGSAAPPVVGFRLRYSRTEASNVQGSDHWAYLTYAYPDPAGPRDGVLYSAYAAFRVPLPVTDGKVREVAAVLPLPQEFVEEAGIGAYTASTPTPYAATLAVSWTGGGGASGTPADSFRVYDVDPIGLDLAKVDALARKALNPPAQEPAQFTLPFLLGPTPSVTLLGAPGGDLTGDVAELEGQHDEQGLTRTTVKLEQPGASETARIIRLVARERAQDAQTQLRGYLER